MGLKALARLVLERDRQRDTGFPCTDSGDAPPVPPRLPSVPPLPPLPTDPAGMLAALRGHGCRVWLTAGRDVRVSPTWRVPPAALERMMPVVNEIAALLRLEN